MIMRKHFYAIPIFIVLFMLMMCPRAAVAGDFEWKIRWQDNGVLQEEIQISGRQIITADTNWNVSQEGDRYILRREVENWQSYAEMKDRLPLQVQSKNYLVYKKIEIVTGLETATGLFQQINDADKINLNITVPGFLIVGFGEKIDESSARWTLNHAELLQHQKMMTVITANGLLLSIGILFLGLLYVAVKFIKQLRKVDQIIAEEYSLTKINSDHPKESE